MALKKHPGFKEAGKERMNGLFAELHPSWQKETALQSLLDHALRGSGNPQLGVISSPASTSIGQ